MEPSSGIYSQKLKSLSCSLGLPKQGDAVEKGIETTEGETIYLDGEFGHYWLNEYNISKKLEIVSSAFGIVLNRYNREDSVSFLHQSINKENEDPEFEMVRISFKPGMNFFQVLDQVKANRTKVAYAELLEQEPHEKRESFFITTLNQGPSLFLAPEGLENTLEIQAEFGSIYPEVNIRIKFNRKNYSGIQMARLGNHVATIFKNGIKFPREIVDKLPMLTPAEEETILVKFNSITNVSAYILNSRLQPVPIGVTGEIYASGAGLMAGYLNEADQVLLPNPFENDALMYKVGDLGHWTENGELVALGKKDTQVRLHRMRLGISEVACIIQTLPGIKQAVVNVSEIQNIKQLVATCSVSDPAICPSEAQIKDFLATRHAIVCVVNFVSEFETNHSGKINRRGFRDIVRDVIPLPEMTKFSQVVKPALILERRAMAVAEEVRQAWASAIGIPEEMVKRDSNFFYLGGSSLQASKLTQLLVGKFKTLKITTVFAFPVFQTFLYALVGRSQPATDIDFEPEIYLDLKIVKGQDPLPQTIKRSLLTGSTGYFGPAILAQLMSSSFQTVVCIIRARNLKEAEERLKLAMSPYFSLEIFQEYEKSRLVILCGDLTIPLFGLDKATYQHLSETTDAIYHSAAEVNHMKGYEEQKVSTVAMQRNLLEFAITEKLKWFHHMSTIAVFNGISLANGADFYIAREIYLPNEINPKLMPNGYAQSKWVCEQIMTNAIRMGLPGAIYRLGEIGSHSTLNIVNHDDSLGSFLLACRRFGSFPDIPCTIPYVRLDSAAKMVVDTSQALLHMTGIDEPVFNVVESGIGIAEFLREDKSKKYETLSMISWGHEFYSQIQWDSKADITVYNFINSIHDENEANKLGFVSKNISFSSKTMAELLGYSKYEIAAGYIKALFNAA